MGNESSQPLNYGERLDNDITVKWNKVSCENPFPPREAHCSCAVNNKLYVFGGVAQAADEDFLESNDLLVHDVEANKWSLAESKGDVPNPRCGATLAAVGDKLYLFGGLSRETGWFDELFMYDTVKNVWSLLETSGLGPSSRDKVCSTVIGEKVYIFGGFGPQGTEEESLEEDEEDDEIPDNQEAAQFGWFNDLYILDTTNNTWSSPMQMNVCPVSPRAAHGMCALDKYIAIFGGRDCDGRTNDLHIFDTETRKWVTDLASTGREPQPRSYHSCVAVGSRIVVMGGRGTTDQHFNDFHVFDTATKQWLQPTVQGNVPDARGTHTVTVVGDQLVMYGGSSDFQNMQCHKFYNDLHTITTDEVKTGKAIPKSTTENQENVSCNVPQSKIGEGDKASNGTASEENQSSAAKVQ